MYVSLEMKFHGLVLYFTRLMGYLVLKGYCIRMIKVRVAKIVFPLYGSRAFDFHAGNQFVLWCCLNLTISELIVIFPSNCTIVTMYRGGVIKIV